MNNKDLINLIQHLTEQANIEVGDAWDNGWRYAMAHILDYIKKL
jgi:hypothetical protein